MHGVSVDDETQHQTSLPANAIDGPIQLITAAERYMQNFRQTA